jgi:chemotaxis protein methyltransferase CheR
VVLNREATNPTAPRTKTALPDSSQRTHTPAQPDRGFAAQPDRGFADFAGGLRRLCGIDLAQYRRGQMERRVRTWVQRRGHEDLAPYLELLRADKAELEAFLDRVTINVSQLWRNPDQWARLEHDVLPELIAAPPAGRLRAWSAGCSYGAEALTLAALARHVAPRAQVRITGTDIDRRIVERARTGVFTAEDARDAPAALLERFFASGDDGTWKARPEILASVAFEVGDLLRLPERREAYDLVLCRNTVIYFNDDVRDALHGRLVASLRPGGYLVVGSTERVTDAAGLGLVGVHPFTYRKGA